MQAQVAPRVNGWRRRLGNETGRWSVGLSPKHNVLAERYGLLCELRDELESGLPAARQTTLEQWLDGLPSYLD